MVESRKKSGFGVAVYLAAMVLSFFFPTAAVVMYLGVALVLFVPFRAVLQSVSVRGR